MWKHYGQFVSVLDVVELGRPSCILMQFFSADVSGSPNRLESLGRELGSRVTWAQAFGAIFIWSDLGFRPCLESVNQRAFALLERCSWTSCPVVQVFSNNSSQNRVFDTGWIVRR